MNHPSVAIIGAGSVGTTTAYALLLQKVPCSIMLIDVDEKRCKGEILDLSDANALVQSPGIRAGTLKDAGNADIIIICAGVRQKEDEPRSALLAANKTLMGKIIEGMKPIKKDALIIVVTNPVDAVTRCVQQLSGLPVNQVFGSGTFLDTQRLRSYIAEKVGISPASIHAYVLGEHGDTQFVAWSSASIGDVPITRYPGITPAILDALEEKTRQHVYKIIECKGATYYGIATCLAAMCETILNDKKRVLSLSCYSEKYKVCISMPAVLGRKGIESILPAPLNEDEQKKLAKSIEVLQAMQQC